jgi:hypothetical protein
MTAGEDELESLIRKGRHVHVVLRRPRHLQQAGLRGQRAIAADAVGGSVAGVVALPLSDGPPVRTDLVWRSDDDNPAVRSLVDLATAWTGRDGREDPTEYLS